MDFKTGSDIFFLLMGAAMVLAMHAGFAFLEVGTVRKKNQVNALMKIISGFSISTVAYFFIGYFVAYGTLFLVSAPELKKIGTVELVRFFFLLTFAAAIPAIISGGIAERARFVPQLLASALLVALIYPAFERIVWTENIIQETLQSSFGATFHDYAGSVVVNVMGGWIALTAVLLLGPRMGRYTRDGKVIAMPPSNIPFLALGSWFLVVGWFGFNVMSAKTLGEISGLVAINVVMAMAGGVLGALIVSRSDPGFVHRGALAGIVAISAGSDVVHPVGGLAIGLIAGVLFVVTFTLCQNRWKIDDVLGVWPLHGLAGAWGGIAAGIFGQKALGGLGGVSFWSQVIGTAMGIAIALIGGFVVYGTLKAAMGIRLSKEQEHMGADLAMHKITANPEEDIPEH